MERLAASQPDPTAATKTPPNSSHCKDERVRLCMRAPRSLQPLTAKNKTTNSRCSQFRPAHKRF
jgi:hypothetical protein